MRAFVLPLNFRERASKPVRHVLDEFRLAASSGALEQHRYLLVVGGLEQLYLVSDRDVVRLLFKVVLLDYVAAIEGLRR